MWANTTSQMIVWGGFPGILTPAEDIARNRDTNTYSNSYCHTYSHSDANSDTDSYGDDNSKPEPDRDGHVYTNGGTEIYTNT